MRIQSSLKSGSGVTPEQNRQVSGQNQIQFQSIMNDSRQKLHHETINQLFYDLEQQGKVLAEKRTVDHLKHYKRLVRQMIYEVVHNGLQREERQGMQAGGRPKTYQVIKQVDEKLVELTNEVLNEERTSMDILSIVGEIKGLVVHLYA